LDKIQQSSTFIIFIDTTAPATEGATLLIFESYLPVVQHQFVQVHFIDIIRASISLHLEHVEREAESLVLLKKAVLF